MNGVNPRISTLRPSCRNETWYDLGTRTPAKILWPMIHNDRPGVYLNQNGVLVDHNLFEIITNSNLEIWASLFWTGQIIFRELYGRANLGQGALKTEGHDIKQLIVIDPQNLQLNLARNQTCYCEVFLRGHPKASEEVGLNSLQLMPILCRPVLGS